MVIWGVIWGAVLGLLVHGWGGIFSALGGALLGMLAGMTLRRAVRAEVQAQMAAARLAPTAEPANVMRTAAEAEYEGPAPVPAFEAGPDDGPVPAPASAPIPAPRPDPISARPPAPTPTPAPRPSPAPVLPPAAPDLVTAWSGAAWQWLVGGNTVVRMGVLVLFVGLAFLAKYAVDNALLPPQLRLAAIGCAGIALFVAGFRLRRRQAREAYALTLQGAGVAVLYLTVFAAFRLYQFLPAGAAFAALALVCAFSAVIAVAQNAQAMALIGFAGGFAAPLLVSSGQGNHVGLFTYYTVLGLAIAALAWARAWRALNLLGFLATFGVATFWGVLRYRPELLASTEPFLIGFFAIYLSATLLYALRHAQAARRAVDATLVFGVPLAAMGLQAALVRGVPYALAFSSLALGALYLAMGLWLARRERGQPLVNRWLAECFAALGLGFATLAVPLALDARWTSAVWAVEGAAVFWMGRRQGRWLPRAAGLLLQVLAAVMFLDGLDRPGGAGGASAGWPLANARFIGAALLAAAALAIAAWSREPAPADARDAERDGPTPGTSSAAAAAFASLERQLSPALLWIGFLWWQFACHGEFERLAPAAIDASVAAIRLPLEMLAWVASAFALHLLALPSRARPWAAAATPAMTVMPVMLVFALEGVALMDHVFQGTGWLAWPLALGLHAAMLRGLDGGAPRGWWPWVHAGGVWLAVLLVGNLLVFAVEQAGLARTAWAAVIFLVAGTAVLLALSRRRLFDAPSRWPWDRFAAAYVWRAAAPVAVLVLLGALATAMHSDGDARPLPYVPVLNPTDLAVALALAACALWLLRLRASALALPGWVRGAPPAIALAAVGFIAVNTVWLRVAHHFAGVAWDAQALASSFLVQAGYSILWTLIALTLMVAAHRRAARLPWMVGAGLLGLTVLKLFVVDLSNRGGGERIVVFIAVGLLMLVVGWVAPLPPARKSTTTTEAA